MTIKRDPALFVPQFRSASKFTCLLYTVVIVLYTKSFSCCGLPLPSHGLLFLGSKCLAEDSGAPQFDRHTSSLHIGLQQNESVFETIIIVFCHDSMGFVWRPLVSMSYFHSSIWLQTLSTFRSIMDHNHQSVNNRAEINTIMMLNSCLRRDKNLQPCAHMHTGAIFSNPGRLDRKKDSKFPLTWLPPLIDWRSCVHWCSKWWNWGRHADTTGAATGGKWKK